MNINASLRLQRAPKGIDPLFGIQVSTSDQLKGAFALSIEKVLGESYAPMHWIYGPRGDGDHGTWPIAGVCPVAWAYAGSLYTRFPVWLRDELLPFTDTLARSGTDAKGMLRRANLLGRFAITETFRLSDFRGVKRHEQKLLKLYDENPQRCYEVYRDLANKLKAPNTAIPLLTTLGSLSRMSDETHLAALRNSILSVSEISAMVAEEAPNRGDYLATWERALATLTAILT